MYKLFYNNNNHITANELYYNNIKITSYIIIRRKWQLLTSCSFQQDGQMNHLLLKEMLNAKNGGAI